MRKNSDENQSWEYEGLTAITIFFTIILKYVEGWRLSSWEMAPKTNQTRWSIFPSFSPIRDIFSPHPQAFRNKQDVAPN